jgi:hypothetical protein
MALHTAAIAVGNQIQSFIQQSSLYEAKTNYLFPEEQI